MPSSALGDSLSCKVSLNFIQSILGTTVSAYFTDLPINYNLR